MTAASALAALQIKEAVIFETLKKTLDQWTEETMLISTENFCPVDKGDMKNSAKNEIVENTSTSYSRECSYNTPYAIYVHEILTNHHPHGQAKFLETPFTIQKPKLEEEMRIAIGGIV